MTEVSSPYPNGTPSWVDLMTSDREAAMEFYRAVFGWDYEVGSPESGYYTSCKLRGKSVAGIGQPPPDAPETPVAWTIYLSIDDVDATVDRAKNAGGLVLTGPMDVFEEGRMAVVADPTGAIFGMWQPGRHFGAQIVNEPGALCWSELATRDTAAAKEFYKAVIGYEMHPMKGDIDYTELRLGDKVVAGLMELGPEFPPEVPSHWMAYFAVADTDATLATVQQQGGTVTNGPNDSPFGRMAVVRDPQGAVFSVIALAPAPDEGS